MDAGIFVKTMFEFKESHANVPHKLNTCVINKVNTQFVYMLTSLTTKVFLSYEINFRGSGGLEKTLRGRLIQVSNITLGNVITFSNITKVM